MPAIDPWKLLAWAGDIAALAAISLAVWCVQEIHTLRTDLATLSAVTPRTDQLPPKWYVESVNLRFATVDQRFDTMQKLLESQLNSIQKTVEKNADLIQRHLEINTKQ